MGEIAEAMLDGTLCEGCGEYLGANTGYPVRCSGCGGDPDITYDEYGSKMAGEYSKTKRASNREYSASLLQEKGIPHEAKNNGAHLIVDGGEKGTIDFWPGTGKWIPRKNSSMKKRGVKSLIKYIGDDNG